MATSNPRDVVRHTDNDGMYETFIADNSTITYDATKAGGSAAVGLAVIQTATADTVALTADGDPIFGKLILVEPDLKCTVQRRGFTTLPGGNGATLTVGTKAVGALGAASAKGYIRTVPETVTTPTAAEVTNAFRAARTKATIINAAVTTAVVVELD